MTGGTNAHAKISVNCAARLLAQLTGKPCDVYAADTKIKISDKGNIRLYCPDVSVICQPNPNSDLFQEKPLLIIEVLSANPRRLGEGEKREAYFTLPSLKYYILLKQESKGAVFYRRDADQWSRVVRTDPNTGFHFLEIEGHLTLT